MYLSISIILLLLVIGNIELNPGPGSFYPCLLCSFKAKTAGQHISHQRIHSTTSNFIFRCPFPLCHHSYDSFKSVSAHLSHHSTVSRDKVVGEVNSLKCSHCDELISTNRDYCRHIKTHLKEGRFSIPCPLLTCSRLHAFTSSTVFATHLSQCHPGWLEDYSNSALQGNISEREEQVEHGEELLEQQLDLAIDDGEDFQDAMDHSGCGHESDSSSSSSSDSGSDSGENMYDHDQVVAYIAHFYAMLEGKHIIPSSTVDSLAEKLATISEILQEKLKRDLTRSLHQAGLSESDAKGVIDGVLSMDPLYNSHHTHAPGDTLLTKTRRLTYYKTNFKHQEFQEINLKKNPKDTEDKVQYVDIKETLNIMLEDLTVQKAVDESFCTSDCDGTLRDYTDGSVYQNSQTPKKRIDIFLFMDSFTCTNALGSAKLKHRIHGMYMTLGNFKPYMRSLLRSMRLVLLVNDKSVKRDNRMYKKCFQKLLKVLKHLEEHGIDYKGEKIAVRIQFIQGDNLGQHTLGGLVESFTGTYFCRFCDKFFADFKNDVISERPKLRFGNWRTPESFNEDLRQKYEQGVENCHGVKRDSPFHKLEYFHVCDPRFPPCIGHDLFIDGVVDNDVRSMIDYFIMKNWFTREFLNMRIRRFKYHGRDGHNKPADLPADSKKLGGHAVQNWTLFRLLPLLIGDRIKTDDEMWKLFLLLRTIIEIVCAPALSFEQVELMRKLIKKYWKKRKMLSNNNYKPKHHFFAHYPELFLRFGPLVFLWTLAFEHRHQFFKKVAKICNNYINLGHLLVKKYLLLQAYENMGPMFPDSPIFSGTAHVEEGTYEDDVQDFLQNSNFQRSAVRVEKLVLNEIKYRERDWLLLSTDIDSDCIIVGQIKIIVFDRNECTAVVKKFQAKKWEEYGLYCIDGSNPQICSVPLNSRQENPCPHAVYDFLGERCLALKHVFCA